MRSKEEKGSSFIYRSPKYFTHQIAIQSFYVKKAKWNTTTKKG